MENGEDKATKWYPAVLCSDLYPETGEYGDIYAAEFPPISKYNFLCPKVDTINISNDPYLFTYGNGTNFVMVVNECNVAE